MKKTFKKCLEVPASCPDFDGINTFSTVTTDLPAKSLFSEKFVLWREKTFFWWFLINLTSFNTSKEICF